jgi:hypothetical protein
MIRKVGPVIAACSLAALAACGSAAASPTASHHTSSPAPAAAPSPTSVGIACGDISANLATVVSDEKTEQAQYQEAWVTGGKSADLQALINETSNAGNGTTQLGSDAQTFSNDANSYLQSNSPYLYPGWEQGYDQVWNDVNALAADCSMPGAGPVQGG